MSVQVRRLLLNLLLLLLVVVLGGVAWWQTSQPKTLPTTLLPLTRADITRVTINPQPGSDKPALVRLERSGDQWQMLEPESMPANSARISQLFTLLDETVEASYAATGKDLKQYGLEPGNASLTLNDEILLFGAENPVSHKRYVLHQGQIKLVSEAVFGLLTGEALELVSRKLVPEGRQVKGLQLPQGHASKPETLQNWQMADAVRLEKLSGKVAGTGNITLTLDDGSSLVFSVLPQAGDLVLVNEAAGLRYTLPEPQRANLLPPAESSP